MRSLENQLVIASNQLSLTQQENAALSHSEAAKMTQLTAALTSLQTKDARLGAAEAALLKTPTGEPLLPSLRAQPAAASKPPAAAPAAGPVGAPAAAPMAAPMAAPAYGGGGYMLDLWSGLV